MKEVDVHVNFKDGLIHLKFPTQFDLCSTMLRPQEFYESSFEEIKGKHFTLDTYMDLYSRKHGSFNYFDEVEGFNIPGNSLVKFFKWFTDLREREVILKHLVEACVNLELDDHFYLIATAGDLAALKHEKCHALYYLNENFKNEIDKMTRFELPTEVKVAITKWLSTMEYCEDVFNDEIQAYIIGDQTSDIYNICKGVPKAKIRKIRTKYRQVYNRYMGPKH